VIKIKLGKVEFISCKDKNNNQNINEILIKFAIIYLKKQGYTNDNILHNVVFENKYQKCYNNSNCSKEDNLCQNKN